MSEVQGGNPNFVHVGPVSDEVTKLAGAKKAYLTFWWIRSLDSHAEGTLGLVVDGAVTETTTSGYDAFVSANAYPVVGQLTPENFQF